MEQEPAVEQEHSELERSRRALWWRAEVGALARLPRPQLRVRVGEVGDRQHLGHRVRALHEVLGRHRLDALGEAGEPYAEFWRANARKFEERESKDIFQGSGN